MSEEDLNARHKAKMQKIKAARDRMMAEKKREKKGLVIVHTGNGKGKSSSAFGMIMRCIAHGMPCGVVQFIKGTWVTGEKEFLRKNFANECKFVVSGEGFTWDTQDRERDIAAATGAWDMAKEMMADPSYDMILLDELNICLRYDYLNIDEVVETLNARREMLHVIVTGRNAKDALIEAADLVTEMGQIKHPFREQNVKAQRGVEF